MSSHKKVRFEFENAEGGTEVESMWAIERAEGYEIDNIPFYVKSIACGDIVSARADDRGQLCFSGLIKASGHSTIRLLFSREEDVGAVREELRRRGCSSEVSDICRLVAVDVPPEVNYEALKVFLDDGERDDHFGYEEACLGFTSAPR